MNPRQEIDFPWGAAEVRSRPTLGRVAEIERKFGPVLQIIGRFRKDELSLTGELLPMLAIMLRGCDGVPKGDAAVMDDIYDIGPNLFFTPFLLWLNAAYVVNEPAPPKDAPAGN